MNIRQQKILGAIVREYFKKLSIIEPNIWCKATEHIKEQIELIKTLEEKGYTYKISDGIYFDTSKLKDYGKLAQLKKEGLEAGKRICLGEKKNITDFALWKFSPSTSSGQAKRQQEWDSPWGTGFPGWHIECSAMSMKYLGVPFDIHTGGIDHIPVHHTNEIAQNEAATNRKSVNFWMHGAFLIFKGEKVSKSTGGLYTISELEKKRFRPLAYRYFTFTAHYRSPLSFSFKNLRKAQKAINNDLDMPVALSVLWNLIRDKKAEGKIKTIQEMDRIFELDLLKEKRVSIPNNVKKLIDQREKARQQKNWQKADELRQKIKKLGYWVEDTDKGPVVKKI